MFHGRRGITSAPMTRSAVAKRAARRSGLGHLRSVPAAASLLPPGGWFRVGMKKRTAAMVIATVPSSIIPGKGKRLDQPGIVPKPSSRSRRKIHSTAVMAKTTSTERSSNEIGPSSVRSRSMTWRSIRTSGEGR